jgi:hypothetical protein
MLNKLSALAILTACCAPTYVLAHSWYPAKCCTAYDCDTADSMLIDEFGAMVIIDGKRRLVIPHSLPRSESPDNNIHICYDREEMRKGVQPEIYCVFLPPQS